MPKRLALSELPAGPKRLASAFARSGWTWNADEATGVDYPDDTVRIYSVVVRGKNETTGRMIAARWEARDRGKLQVNKCYMVCPELTKRKALEYSVTEVFQYVV